jgi:cleavage and polyadenylation specificity factor subunit 1
MKVMRLRSQETLSGRKEFIVVGATVVIGEEVNAKGKLMIFDITEVIPEPGKPLTQYRLKVWSMDIIMCVNLLTWCVLHHVCYNIVSV